MKNVIGYLKIVTSPTSPIKDGGFDSLWGLLSGYPSHMSLPFGCEGRGGIFMNSRDTKSSLGSDGVWKSPVIQETSEPLGGEVLLTN